MAFEELTQISKIFSDMEQQINVLEKENADLKQQLCLPKDMKKFRADTIWLKLLKIAGKLVKSARKLTFKLCSSYPYIQEFCEIFANIDQLVPKLE